MTLAARRAAATSTTVVASGSGSTKALYQLLATPGSAYFSNMVLAFRMAGATTAGGGAGGSVSGIFNQSLSRAATAVGNFVTSLVSPSNDPAVFVNAFGSAVQETGSLLAMANPVVGAFTVGIGAAVGVVGDLMQAFDGMVDRYAKYNPEIAVAKAEADVAQIMNDMRRAQQAGPSLIQYIQQRQDMQQKVEDMKIRIMQTVMPAVLHIMELIEKLMPLAETLVEIVTPIVDILVRIIELVAGIFASTKEKGKEESVIDINAIVKNAYVEPGSEKEKELRKRKDASGEFFKVPRF